MKVKVKLYGTLGEYVPGYELSNGIEVEIPDGGKVKDILSVLHMPESQGVVVVIGGIILTTDYALHDGTLVSLLQPLSGG
jgi:sulfur carrier protein ThiS